MHARLPLQSARWTTFLTFLANGFGLGAWATAVAPLKVHLSLSPASLSFALLGMAIGGVIAMQPASRIIPRLGGTGHTVRLIGVAYAVALALPLLSPNLPVLILCCALLGASNGLLDVAMNAHAASVERSWGSAIMSSFHAGWSLGGFIGTGFGALMLTLHLPVPFLMLPTAGAVLIVSLAAGRYIGPGDTARHESQAVFRLPERRVIRLAAVLTLCFMVEGAMADWSAIYLTSLGESVARATAGYAAFSAAMVLGRILGDAIVRKLGRAQVISGGTALAATGLILATSFPQLVTVVIGFALVGIGLSNVVPCVFSMAAAKASSPAAGIAEVSTAGFGGFLGGPPLIGAVAAHAGMRSGIGVIAAAASLATVLALTFKTEEEE